MKSNNLIQFEDYLQELVQNTPSSKIKLLSAWDGLTIELQIKILYYLKEKTPNKLKLKALQSSSQYVRYLIAKYSRPYYNDDDILLRWDQYAHSDTSYDTLIKIYDSEIKSVSDLIAKDESSIVKGVQVFNNSYEEFFTKPLDEQIIALNLDTNKIGWIVIKKIIELFEYAIETNSIGDYEIAELIEDHLKNPFIIEYYLSPPVRNYYDFPEPLTSADLLEKLWNLLPRIGKSRAGFIMANYLPVQPNWQRIKNWNDNILTSIDKNIMLILLHRKDIYLNEFRKDILFSRSCINDWDIVKAALSSILNLTFEEVEHLLASKNYTLFKAIIEANNSELKIRPVYIYALADILRIHESTNFEYYDMLEKFDKLLGIYVRNFTDAEKLKIAHELALYSLSMRFITYGENDIKVYGTNKDKWFFLNNHVISGDIWKTFMSFSSILKKDPALFKDWLIDIIKDSFPSVYPDYLNYFKSNEQPLYSNRKNKLAFKLDFLYQHMNKIIYADNSNTILLIIVIILTSLSTLVIHYYLFH